MTVNDFYQTDALSLVHTQTNSWDDCRSHSPRCINTDPEHLCYICRHVAEKRGVGERKKILRKLFHV